MVENSPLLSLIDVLAKEAVADYLRSEATPSKAANDSCTYPAPLRDADRAA